MLVINSTPLNTVTKYLYKYNKFLLLSNKMFFLVKQFSKSRNETLMRQGSQTTITNLANQYKIDLDDEGLGLHDKKAFAKCCETLTFLIRDMAHITLQNFESCIHCLRTFVEACVVGGEFHYHFDFQNKFALIK